MNNIAEYCTIKYKEELSQAKIILQDDGEGVYIKEWNLSGIKEPTKEEIDIEIVGLRQQKENTINNETIYNELEKIDLKSIRALRTGDTNRLESLEQDAIALRAQLIK